MSPAWRLSTPFVGTCELLGKELLVVHACDLSLRSPFFRLTNSEPSASISRMPGPPTRVMLFTIGRVLRDSPLLVFNSKMDDV
jgi:hypothetical protein